jgi:hypothetical protein
LRPAVPAAVLIGLLAFVAPSGAVADPVVAAAGDIACDPTSAHFNGGEGDATNCRQKATSELLLSGIDAVLPLGDTQYHEGALAKYQQSYEPSWGRVRSHSHPVIGNHEYYSGSGSPLGSGYFDYFNGVGNATGPAGDRSKGYYSFELGSWHLVAINSNCAQVGGCEPGSAQEQWLRADLAQHPTACTLAYWHHPRFSSGGIGDHPALEPIWQALYDGGADVVLNGHDHNYERFAPQNPAGAAEPSYGIREFVAGTGGKSLLAMGATRPNSQVRNNTTFGVLQLTLHAGGYDWAFVPVPGGAFADSGSSSCHAKPPPGRPRATTGEAAGVTETAATLTASVSPSYRATTYRFQYGISRQYGSSTPERSVGYTDGAFHPVFARVQGLRRETTYHYRVVARNASGTVYGVDRQFRTVTGDAYSGAVLATPGLSAYWRLGEANGTTATDQLGAHPGTYRGGVTLGRPGALVGAANTAAYYDGASGEMTAGAPAVSGVGSVEGWFKWETGTSLMRDHSTYTAGGWILAYDSGGSVKYRVAGKTYSTGRSAASLRDGGWHHVVLTKNAGQTALYLDGQPAHRGTGAPNAAVVGPWHVMRNGAYAVYSRGLADELAVYRSALSSAAVQQHYAAGR